MLRAHNELVRSRDLSFEQAGTELRRHYQWIALHDFQPRICHPYPINRALAASGRLSRLPFMPLEFSVAGYRFGHSMVRATYNHNVNFPAATLAQMFQFTAASGGADPLLSARRELGRRLHKST